MSTVTFAINPAHINHYISEKGKGGVCIEVTNTSTQETGWMYIGHTSRWENRKHLLQNKVKWVASCYLKDSQFSPFPEGNQNEQIKTKLRGELLIVEKVISLQNHYQEQIRQREIQRFNERAEAERVKILRILRWGRAVQVQNFNESQFTREGHRSFGLRFKRTWGLQVLYEGYCWEFPDEKAHYYRELSSEYNSGY